MVSSRSPLRLLRIAAVLISGAVAAACPTGCSDIRIEMNAEHATKWADAKTGSGAEVKPGMEVEVVYWLALPDGTRVVDLYEQEKTHPFRVGDGTVIAGLDQAVRGMRRGGVRDVVLPPISHYGRQGYAGIIPEDTTLTMRVEMLSVRY